jgi:hypothetical protein
MGFWDKIQEDIKNNLQEGVDIFKEGSSVFQKKLEEFTDGGKRKYKEFNLNMKVQDEFAKLGGEIYDLISKKAKNPLGNRSVTSIIKRINKLEADINKLETKEAPAVKKKTAAKKKTTAKKKTATKKKTTAKKKTTVKKKTTAKKKAVADTTSSTDKD